MADEHATQATGQAQQRPAPEVDAQGRPAAHGGCAGNTARAVPPVRVPVAPAAPAPLGAPAFQMLGSDDVGVCVDGVCEIPGAAAAPAAPTAPQDS